MRPRNSFQGTPSFALIYHSLLVGFGTPEVVKGKVLLSGHSKMHTFEAKGEHSVFCLVQMLCLQEQLEDNGERT